MASVFEVAKYLINSLPIDNLKLQKLLYYSQAVHLVLHEKRCLFSESIEAWDYGPVVPNVYHEYKHCGFDTIPSTNELPVIQLDDQKSINIVICALRYMSGTELIDQTHREMPWRKAYRPGRNNIISIDSMYDYFRENLAFSKIGFYMSTNRSVRASISNFYSIFINIKRFVNKLLTQNNNVSFLEDPSVNIESIAIRHGITNIRYVPSIEVNGKHALLIGTEILVNNRDNPEKQRFSIAHEIFHFFTREDNNNGLPAVARQGETWKRQHANSSEAVDEEIADYFAANLLIPTERFILWEDKSNEEIAHVFGVEVRCIQKRREEIEQELDLMVPQNQSSDDETEEQSLLSLDELDQVLEVHSVHDNGRV